MSDDALFPKIVPNNLLQDEQMNAAAYAVDTQLNDVTEAIENITFIDYLDRLPDAVLTHLLYEFNIEIAEGLGLANSREKKIELIKSAITLHRTKGTKAAIEEVFRTLNKQANIQEWFEYEGDPYHFKIDVELPEGMSQEEMRLMDVLIREFKNARSHLEVITFNVPISNSNVEATAIVEAESLLVYPEVIEVFVSTNDNRHAIALIESETITVYPARSDI